MEFRKIVMILAILNRASQVALMVKNPPANAGDMREDDLNPGSGRSPGGGNGNPLLYLRLENSMDRGAWWATVHGVTKSWMQLSTYKVCCISFHNKYFIVALICVSLCHMLGVSFHMLICHVYILFSEVALKTFGPFFSQVVFLLLNFKNSLLILDSRALSEVSFANISSQCVVCILIFGHFLMFFTEQKF